MQFLCWSRFSNIEEKWPLWTIDRGKDYLKNTGNYLPLACNQEEEGDYVLNLFLNGQCVRLYKNIQKMIHQFFWSKWFSDKNAYAIKVSSLLNKRLFNEEPSVLGGSTGPG